MNDLKVAKYVPEEKDCLLKDMNASINAKESERNKYKGQVHGLKVFLDQIKDALAREMQVKQSKSMELDALWKEKVNKSIYMVHQSELEKAKCSSDEEEDDESISNKKFPTGSTLDQRFVENEGVPTAESPTAEIEVVPTAESPNTFIARPILDQRFAENEGVLTAGSPTAKMEVVPTAESPTPRTYRDERAIHRNAKNPSGKIENEGDERKVNSLSPSTINIKKKSKLLCRPGK